jgi:hypothetical protein
MQVDQLPMGAHPKARSGGGQKSLLKLVAQSAMFDRAIVRLLFDNLKKSSEPSALSLLAGSQFRMSLVRSS